MRRIRGVCPSCGGTRIDAADLERQCYTCGHVWEEDDDRLVIRDPELDEGDDDDGPKN